MPPSARAPAGAPEGPRPLVGGKLEVEHRDQVEGAGGRGPLEHVGGDPLDLGARGGRPAPGRGQRDLREVHRGHVPAPAGQPDRGAAAAAGQVERPPGDEGLGLLAEHGVDPLGPAAGPGRTSARPSPDSSPGARVLGLLARRGGRRHGAAPVADPAGASVGLAAAGPDEAGRDEDEQGAHQDDRDHPGRIPLGRKGPLADRARHLLRIELAELEGLDDLGDAAEEGGDRHEGDQEDRRALEAAGGPEGEADLEDAHDQAHPPEVDVAIRQRDDDVEDPGEDQEEGHQRGQPDEGVHGPREGRTPTTTKATPRMPCSHFQPVRRRAWWRTRRRRRR